ncbi:hypothetical protein FBZ86_11226 [Gluconacetobacter diazotrophicus]|nr:hypothetical protein FBZ86_11226 [Gluconacetobacter diazotrophicus]
MAGQIRQSVASTAWPSTPAYVSSMVKPTFSIT